MLARTIVVDYLHFSYHSSWVEKEKELVSEKARRSWQQQQHIHVTEENFSNSFNSKFFTRIDFMCEGEKGVLKQSQSR
jgi:hypothetical protein